MKTQIRIFAMAILLIGISISTFAQNGSTATAPASANVLIPIAITKTTDMSFGNLAVSQTSGTVVLSTSGSRTNFGGVTLPSVTGTVSAASFTVTGEPNFTYGIILPSTITLTSVGNDHMTVNTFLSNPSAIGTLSTGGSQTLSVGATLNVNFPQGAGTYTNNSDLTVWVNYN